MSFVSLGLSAELLRAISEQGYTEPTPIQRQAIPVILDGRDVLAGAQTGTGKTAGFTLPLLQRLCARPTGKGLRPVRALILTPTRELAAQVADSVTTYGRHLPLQAAVIFGGVNINPQIAQLRRGVDILVATPGRLLDHVGQKTLDLSRVEILVLDEADRMLDMGFIHDIRKVLALLPDSGRRQSLLFSATFSDEIKQLADRLLNRPELIEVARRNITAERIEQRVHPVDKARKRELLSHLIGAGDWRQVLVFTRTKHGANRLAQQLEQDGLSAAAIHGNKSQAARTRALAGFKQGEVRVLVATDIAARGLDIDQLPHVVNYELPNVPEDYVHRIGRTGRAGYTGEAISLVCVDELGLLRDIERLLRRELPKEVLTGYAPDPSIAAEPILNGRNGSPAPRVQRAPARRTRDQGAGRVEGPRSVATTRQAAQPKAAPRQLEPISVHRRPSAPPEVQTHRRPWHGPVKERSMLLGGGLRED
jgi:ATP-dependent RNA helicase RhlE